jgi:hypothetical protein
MRTVKVSDAVWEEIAKRGKFGETVDDVLRREFGLATAGAENRTGRRGRGRTRYASKRMSARVESGKLVVAFADGVRDEWILPQRADKAAIRTIREAAVSFALKNGASDPGQTNAVRKALTEAGYHLNG